VQQYVLSCNSKQFAVKSTKIDYGTKKFNMYFSEEVVASTLGIFDRA
jgi:hypothetical protein